MNPKEIIVKAREGERYSWISFLTIKHWNLNFKVYPDRILDTNNGNHKYYNVGGNSNIIWNKCRVKNHIYSIILSV